MIILVDLDIEELIDKKQDYPWPKLPCCPKCKGKIWGHGFVQRWLDVSDTLIFLKRSRCTCCYSITCMRPNTHFKGFYYSIKHIFSSLKNQIIEKIKSPEISISLQNIWMKAFRLRAVQANLAAPFSKAQLPLFNLLLRKEMIPVSRSNKLKSNTLYYHPT